MNKLKTLIENYGDKYLDCYEYGGKEVNLEKKYDKIIEFINQNYISKEQILNLECLKEEKHSHDCNKNVPELKNLPCDCDNGLRNKLRTEIKEEIKKL